MIVDDGSSGTILERALRRSGLEVQLALSFDEAQAGLAAGTPDLVVTELKIGTTWAFDFLARTRLAQPAVRLAVVTNYPSVATAVRALRLGADGYLAKPTDAEAVLRAVSGEVGAPVVERGEPAWPSLDRTIWEYLNQVYLASGTLSEAARCLGIDRRSLRRMMKKFPPTR